MHAAKAIAPALAAALMAAGCGGGSGGGDGGGGGGNDGRTDKQAVEAAVTAYYRAFGKGDGAAACALLAKDARADLVKAGRGKRCPELLEDAVKRPDYAKVASRLSGVKVTGVTIAGKAATAATEVPGVAAAGGGNVSTTVPLKKEGANWKISTTLGSG